MTGQVSRTYPTGTHRFSTDKIDCERLEDDARPDSSQSSKIRSRLWRLAGFMSLFLLLQQFWPASFLHDCFRRWQNKAVLALDDLCPQAEALIPPKYETLLSNLDDEFASNEFRLKAYESLGGAVRIPTESYDDLGPPSEDSRWEIMGKFHEYLQSRFPKVHANLQRTKVNTYALVYEWKGTENVKPLLLAAHMDVVPVDPATYENWIHPPYSGYYDGEWIWGRGSCDDKAPLTAILTAIETLLEHGFVPSRTVVLAVGSDEENGGSRGAREIRPYLLENYGPDSFSMIVDEGDGFIDLNGLVFATPSVAEKGAMNIRMDVLTPGGHSSTPPKHTGIGILANLITELEAYPHQPELVRGRTYYKSLECRAKYDTSFPETLTKLVLESQTSDEKLRELGDRLVDFDPLYYAMSGTTQAVDLVGGGVKVNALPEIAWAVVNHRIADHSSLSELMARFTDVTLPVAAKHNMTLDAFGQTVGSQGPSWGTIRLYSASNNPLAPAPVTPTTGGPYELLSGTIRSTFETHLRTDQLPKAAIVSPWVSTGNTGERKRSYWRWKAQDRPHDPDTRYYWDLTRHIFRYHHRGSHDVYNGIHGTNEAIRAEGFLEQIRFFTRLILNADQSNQLE